MNETDRVTAVQATACRRELGLGDTEPIDIIKVLHECLDVSVIVRRFSSGFSGMFLRTDTAGAVVLNATKSLGHQHFTAAHELFHLRFETGLTHQICLAGQFTSKNRNELEADCFAANLLMPQAAVLNRLYGRSASSKQPMVMEDVIDLGQHFGVSHAAMLIRLKRLGIFTDSQAGHMNKNVTEFARSRGYNITLYRPSPEETIYSSYVQKAYAALDRSLITEGKFQQLLLEADYADLLYGGPEGDAHEDV